MTSWLADTLLYTGVLIALVLLVRRPVARELGPRFAYALWALPALRFVLPPIVLPASMAPAAPEPGAEAFLVLAMAAEAAPTGVTVPEPAWQASDLLLPLWLGGAALFLAWRSATYLRMRRELLAEARPVGEVGRIRIVETPAVDSPVAFGVRDKVVALPLFFMAMEDRASRDLAIAHELAHHRGHDLLANFAAQPLLALHWFNPLAWLGWRAMRRDQEAACDARVLEGQGQEVRAAYAGVIAGFAAGPRLALAAPMACPVLGEKSIIHRLRSLSMSDTSPRRRLVGRLLLAGGAIALPLTASVSYAAADKQVIEEVELPPSAVAPPPPPAPVAALDAPPALAAPAVPPPPPAPEIDEQAHVARTVRIEERTSADHRADMRQHVVAIRGHERMTEEQRERFEEMRRELEHSSADWEKFAQKYEKMAEEFAEMAASVPNVVERCDGSGDVTRTWVDEQGRTNIMICERAATRHALMGLRSARNAIARNGGMNESTREEVLEELDREIAELEADS